MQVIQKDIKDDQPETVIPLWTEVVNCPNCGLDPMINIDYLIQWGSCNNCCYPWCLEENIFIWGHKQKEFLQKWKIIYKKIKNQLNPTSSFILPFRYISNIQEKKYYNRTLSDKRLAIKWYKHYLSEVSLKKGDIVLDYGCGKGRITAISNQLGFITLAQDVQKHSWWKKILNSRFQVVPESATRLPWRDNIFSAIFIFMVHHHLEEKDLLTYTKEIFRILKPGGICILAEANDQGYAARVPLKHYGRLHSINIIRHFYQSLGFKEISLNYEGFYSPIFPLFVNFIRRQILLKSYDMSDFGSRLESFIPPNRRALWVLKLQKPK